MSDPQPTPAAASTVQDHHGTGRTVGAIVCIVLAALLTAPAAVAYWGQRTLNDAQRYVATVGPLVNSPAVQDAIANKVTDAIQKQVDVPKIINDVFGGVITSAPRLKELVGPLSGAVNGLIDNQVNTFVASDTFADLWVQLNTKAQEGLMRLLKGESGGAVSLQGDQVVLDVSDVIDQVKARLVARGLTIVQNIPVPNVDKQIVLLNAPRLKQAKTIYAFANPVAKWLIVVVAALYLGALLVARRRPRMTVTIGIVLAANALLVAQGLAVGRQLFINQLAGTDFGPAASVFYAQLLSYLVRGWQVILWLGVVLVVVGWFAGRNGPGTAVRHAVSGGLETAGAALPGGPVRGAGRWCAANATWLRVAVGVVGVVVLLWGNDVSLGRLFWSLVTVVGLLAVVQVLVGAGAGSPDDGGAHGADSGALSGAS
jgi:hypothetical protein